MKFRFTELVDRYKYPLHRKSELLQYFSKLFEYGCNNFTGTKDFKRNLLNAFNVTTYWTLKFLNKDILEDAIDMSNYVGVIDDDTLKSVLGPYYIDVSDIEWDIDIVDSNYTENYGDLQEVKSSLDSVDNSVEIVNNSKDVIITTEETVLNPTPLEDLSIKGPRVPFFDVNSIYREGTVMVIIM